MKILREPLFHFLLLGAAIFAVHAFVTRHENSDPEEIVVTQGTIENLTTGFTRTWQRPPTDEELEGLVREYVREEVAYHEALALGLDRDDMVVRRRLRQKLEFLTDEPGSQTEPTDAELSAFLATHREQFQEEPNFSFLQIYFDPQRHGQHLQEDMERALDRLRHAQPADATADVGDPFVLGSAFEASSLSDVRNTFGDPFASAVSALPTGTWQGPIPSSYGAHLVFVQQHTEGRLPTLVEVRSEVRREFLDSRRKEATDRFYDVLLTKRYTVRMEHADAKIARTQ